jgi:hypothetical protein
MRPLRARWRAAAAAVLAIACTTDRTVGPETVTALAISPDSLEVGVGQSGYLRSVAIDAHGIPYIGVPTTWTSQNPAVATVSDDGLVSGVAVGTTTITGTAAGLTASATVRSGVPPVIALSRTSVGFTGVAGGPSVGPDSVAVTNLGGVGLHGLTVDAIAYAGASTGWLTATLDGATAPTMLRLTAAPAGLSAGSHRATVSLAAPAATNSPQSITVDLVLGGAPPSGSQIAVHLGNSQTARVGTSVPVNPSVVVRDALNNPVPYVLVTFAVASGGGSVTADTPVTDANGIATIGSWTLGGTSADAADGTMANALSASASGTNTVTFTASAIYEWDPDVQPLVTGASSGCDGCHSVLFTRNPNTIVGVNATTGAACDLLVRVVAGDATNSVLYRKVTSTPSCGGVMPPATTGLGEPQLKIIRAWINNGALDN